MTIHEDASNIIHGAVNRLVRDAGGAFTEEPVWEGAASTVMRPDPRLATTAAIALYYQAGHRLRRAIADSRAAGTGWQEIADDLGFTTERPAIDRPEYAAWRFAAEGVLPGQDVDYDQIRRYSRDPYVSWTCNTCTKLIIERDLDDGLNAQTGHTDDCPRHTAEWAAERARDND